MGCSQSKSASDAAVQRSSFQTPIKNKSNPLTESEIQSRIESPKESIYFEIEGVRMRYAYMSQRGYYPEALDKDNQDAYQVLTNYGSSNASEHQAFFAIYDGHGKDGHHCARFARDHLSKNILEKFSRIPTGGMTPKAIKQALTIAHYSTNDAMHADKHFDDSLSGTTAISILFRGRTMYVSNVGDSRAIIVSKVGSGNTAEGDDASTGGRLVAKPMSSDQTPYRKDERDRVKKYGARILSMDQIEGIEPPHENWGDLNLGEDIDEGGDPPRIWSPKGDYPGTAFTRSLGDVVAEECGVIPEPEILEREIQANDKYIVIASDGVFEFLTNQMVADALARFSDPLEGCKAIVNASYNMWLQYEVRTDDITIIAMAIDEVSRVSTAFNPSSSFFCPVDFSGNNNGSAGGSSSLNNGNGVSSSVTTRNSYDGRDNNNHNVASPSHNNSNGSVAAHLSHPQYHHHPSMAINTVIANNAASVNAAHSHLINSPTSSHNGRPLSVHAAANSTATVGAATTAAAGGAVNSPLISPSHGSSSSGHHRTEHLIETLEARPVRRTMSREKRKNMIQLKNLDEAEDGNGNNDDENSPSKVANIPPVMIPKELSEEQVIQSAMKSNFLFQHLNASQRQAVIGVMSPVVITKGDWIIKQGDAGDKFYVVDKGKFEVRVRSAAAVAAGGAGVAVPTSTSTPPPSDVDGSVTSTSNQAAASSLSATAATASAAANSVIASVAQFTDEEKEKYVGTVVHVYESGPDQHPGFGELSLMYGKPRAASVIALTDGKLWALDRRTFRKVVLRPKDRKDIIKIFKKVELFRALNINQMQRLVDLMNERTYSAEEMIIRQGEEGNTFYILESGTCDCTINKADGSGESDVVMTLKDSSYFGERALLESKPRAANVIAKTENTKVMYIEKAAFEEVLGPLAKIIDEDRMKREELALLRLSAPQSLQDIQVKAMIASDSLGPLLLGYFKLITKETTTTTATAGKAAVIGGGKTTAAGDGTPTSTTNSVISISGGTGKKQESSTNLLINIGSRTPSTTKVHLVHPTTTTAISPGGSKAGGAGAVSVTAAATTPSPVIKQPVVVVIEEEDDEEEEDPEACNMLIRSFIFSEIVKNNLSDSVHRYLEAAKLLQNSTAYASALVPRCYTIIRQPNAVHLIFDAPVINDLASFIRNHPEELSVDANNSNNHQYITYTLACMVSALETLHDVGIVYRAVQPEAINLDIHGRIVFIDYRFCRLGIYGSNKAFTICGASDYLAPEQISQTGHSYAVDLWGMGVLLYELAVGSHPFSSNTEVATYSRISAFGTKSFPALKFPENFRPDTKSLINQLLMPTPEARIGSGINGFAAIKKHAFFHDFSAKQWETIHVDPDLSPLKTFAMVEKHDLLREEDGGVLDNTMKNLSSLFAQEFTGTLPWLKNLDV